MMNSNSIVPIEKRLSGFRNIRSVHLDAKPDLSYDLILILEQEESGKTLRIELRDVSDLRLESFGGGLMQFRLLKIEDVSDRQWDRVRFHISELEDAQFECSCADVAIDDL